MPILTLQRRLREIGRLRIGQKVEGEKNGRRYTRPEKLDRFRFTSQDRRVIEAASVEFGGTVEPWDDAPSGQQWQVVSEARELPVLIPPGQAGFSQFYELWSAGGCQRRCDGERELISDKPCVCDEENPEERACAPHTRLSVILRGLDGLGVWRLDSQGYYAATELAGAADVCAAATARGHMLPARLRLEQRSVKRPKKNGNGIETFRFVVPVLDVDVPIEALAQLGMSPVATLEAGAAGELPAPSFGPVPVDALPAGPQPSVADQMATVGDPEPRRQRSNAAEPIPSTGLEPRTAAEAADGSDADFVFADRADLVERVKALPSKHRDELNRARTDDKLPSLMKGTFTAEKAERYRVLVGEYERRAGEEMSKVRQALAIRCRNDLELDDDGRHALVRYATGGERSGLSECSLDELDRVRGAIADVEGGRVVMRFEDDGVLFEAAEVVTGELVGDGGAA